MKYARLHERNWLVCPRNWIICQLSHTPLSEAELQKKGPIDLIWIILLIIGLFCQLSHRFLSDFELKSNNEA